MDAEGGSDKLDTVINMLQEMATDMHLTRKELQEVNKELSTLRKENEQLRNENKEIKREYELIKTDIGVLKEKIEFMEKGKRRMNVIVTGMDMEAYRTEELQPIMEDFIEKKLEVKTSIETATKIGGKTCLLSFKHFEDKVKVLKNKSKLKKIKSEKIYINEDYTLQEREIQKQLRLTAKEEREKGKTVKIGYQKLEIDKEIWKWNVKTNRLEQGKRQPKN